MPFNTTELDHIHATAGALVERRQPLEHLRDQLRLELEIDGHKVRIWTIRPQWNDPSKHIRSGVAQFTYTRSKDSWKLHWMRRDGKWHPWDPDENTGRIEQLVQIVDEDRHGGFWG